MVRWWRRSRGVEAAGIRYPEGLGDTPSIGGNPAVATLADHLLREANKRSSGGAAPRVDLEVPLRRFLESYDTGRTRGGWAFIMGERHITKPEPLFSDFRREVVEPALILMRTAAPDLTIRMDLYTSVQYNAHITRYEDDGEPMESITHGYALRAKLVFEKMN
jgi:hypothetical protein